MQKKVMPTLAVMLIGDYISFVSDSIGLHQQNCVDVHPLGTLAVPNATIKRSTINVPIFLLPTESYTLRPRFSNRNRLLLMLLVGSSSIYSIYPWDPGLIPSGLPASLRCQLETSDNFRLQYVTWFKISLDDSREFLYHYDQCTGDNRAYGSLAGRARVTITSHRSSNTVSLDFIHVTYYTAT